MPVYIDINENEVLGPPYRKGLAEGRQEGLQEGVQKGQLIALRQVIQKRFGNIPDWVEQRLASRSAAELEELLERALDAASLTDLLR